MVDTAYVSFRIGTGWWMDEQAFGALLGLFGRYPGLTDNLVFFTSATHAPLPLDEMRRRLDVLRGRMRDAREQGLGAGVNVLATLGHHEENLPNSLRDGYTFTTDLDGATCRGSLCPASPSTYAYVAELYRSVALSEPDCVWVDDDVRLLGHMPVVAGCFCDHCLETFAAECGTRHSRQSLRDALDHGPVERRLGACRAWIDHNRKCVRDLLAHIEEAVHSVAPDTPLGFMTGDRFYEGYGFHEWAEALSGPRRVEVLWRPGGGFYSDSVMSALAGKSHDVGRQVSALPQSVVRILSEVESFPYQSLKKGPRVTALEAASHVAAGCTGAAFNVLPERAAVPGDPFLGHEPIIAELASARGFLDRAVSIFGRSARQGLYTGWSAYSFTAGCAAGDWLAGDTAELAGGFASELLETGLPAAYAPEAASVTLLNGDAVLAMNEQQLLRALSSGAYMDARALAHLNARGYSDLTGVEVSGQMLADGIEELVKAGINGDLAGARRDCRQSFRWGPPAAALTLTDSRTQPLARLVDYSDAELSPCCMAVFENRLGGRVCVAGYYPWSLVQDVCKSTQMKSLMRWLSADTLPAYMASFHRANIWARVAADGSVAAAVINAGIETIHDMTVAVRTDLSAMRVCDMECRESDARCVGSSGPYRLFRLPPVGPWEMRLLW